jgi:hypothetical protein
MREGTIAMIAGGALSETEALGSSRSLVRKKMDAAANRPGTKVHK